MRSSTQIIHLSKPKFLTNVIKSFDKKRNIRKNGKSFNHNHLKMENPINLTSSFIEVLKKIFTFIFCLSKSTRTNPIAQKKIN